MTLLTKSHDPQSRGFVRLWPKFSAFCWGLGFVVFGSGIRVIRFTNFWMLWASGLRRRLLTQLGQTNCVRKRLGCTDCRVLQESTAIELACWRVWGSQGHKLKTLSAKSQPLNPSSFPCHTRTLSILKACSFRTASRISSCNTRPMYTQVYIRPRSTFVDDLRYVPEC